MDIKDIQRQFSLDDNTTADATASAESHQEPITIAPDTTPMITLTEPHHVDLSDNHVEELKRLRDHLKEERAINKSSASEILFLLDGDHEIRFANEGYFTEYPSEIGYQETMEDLTEIIEKKDQETYRSLQESIQKQLNELKHQDYKQVIIQERDLYNKIKSEISFKEDMFKSIDSDQVSVLYQSLNLDEIDALKKALLTRPSQESMDIETALSTDIYTDLLAKYDDIIALGIVLTEKSYQEDRVEQDVSIMKAYLSFIYRMQEIIYQRHRLHVWLSHLDHQSEYITDQ
nr:MAG TPA: hypothetical protein [Caudoviricetes sp.]